MAFSSNNNYLVHHPQLIDDYQIRKNNQPDNFLVWDNTNHNSVKNFDGHKEAVLNKFQFPNHIYGKYQFFEGNLKDSSTRDDERLLKK